MAYRGREPCIVYCPRVVITFITFILGYLLLGNVFGRNSFITIILSLVLAFAAGFGFHFLLLLGETRRPRKPKEIKESKYKSQEDKVTSKKFCTVCKIKFFKEPEMLYKCTNCGLKMHKKCFDQVDNCPTCGHSFLE